MKIYKLKVNESEKIFRNLQSFKNHVKTRWNFDIETVDEFNKPFATLSNTINVYIGMNSLNITIIDKKNIIKAYNRNEKMIDIVNQSNLSKASICNILNAHREEVCRTNRSFKREIRRVFKTEEQLKKEILEASRTSKNLTQIARNVGTSFYKARNILNNSLTSETK